MLPLLLLMACAGGDDPAPDDTAVVPEAPVPGGSVTDAAGALTGSGARSYVGSAVVATATAADGGPGLFVSGAVTVTLTPRPTASAELWTATVATLPAAPTQGLADLDGDGAEDIFLAGSGGYDEDGWDHAVRLWRGPFTGSIGWASAAVQLAGWTNRAEPATTGAVSPDLDGDGLADALYADGWSDDRWTSGVEVRTLPPDAAGDDPGVTRIVGLSDDHTWYVTPVGDADGDGLADLVVSGEAGGRLFFGPLAPDTPADAADGTGVDALPGVAADLDGDGRAELFAPTTDGAVHVLGLEGGDVPLADRVRATILDEAGEAPEAFATSAADIDRDGRSEVALGVAWGGPLAGGAYLLRAPFTGTIALDRVERWYGEPDGYFGRSVALTAEDEGGRLYVGDPFSVAGDSAPGAVYWFAVE